ncbi:MAG: type II toxin-antitoxin system VapC family toxin [Planctomycetes bacterium]|nr:type II toxin-antitoxin system VapC family toxin [Planctomycetota bacterium]
MKTVFADTFVWLALVHPKDAWHERAKNFLDEFSGRIVTTDWVLMELADALAGSEQGRREFVALRADLHSDPDATIVPSDSELLQQAIDLYHARLDKQWSLTDCTSFVVMQREEITEALTGDHHFEQAGFVILLK